MPIITKPARHSDQAGALSLFVHLRAAFFGKRGGKLERDPRAGAPTLV